MFAAGIDIFRLNFSHQTHEEHAMVIQIIHRLNKEFNSSVAILADLQGPKLRVGEVEHNGVMLENNSVLSFVTKKCVGTSDKVYMSYSTFPQDVEPGNTILIDDGKLKLEVIETNNIDNVKARVIYGGLLSSKKGVNLPDTKISQPSLTEKDLADVDFLATQDIDWIALSFVRSATNVVDLKDRLKKHKKSQVRVMAKIEKPEALKEIENIIEVADGIMVARGDLGVEVPFDQVPLIQKQIVNACIIRSKPVVIATQMMESMISSFRPTRAEANDVANAVFDGTDCLMLSGETSIGKFPIEAIKSMQRIIDFAEGKGFELAHDHKPDKHALTFLPDSICYNACKMANQAKAKAIITFTYSGSTALKIASYRPSADVFAFSSNKKIIKMLSLVWGVRAYYLPFESHINQAIPHTIEILKEKGILETNNVVIHVGSIPIKERGQTNLIKISYVD